MNPPTSLFDLSGRTYLVTGASSGIGKETAILLSKLGARLVLAGRNEDRLRETLSAMAGSAHELAPFDLADTQEICAWVKKLVAQSGPLDGLVHAAGVQRLLPLKIVESRDIEDLFRINVSSAIMLAKAFRQRGVHGPHGNIVFLSSARGLVGEAGLALYSASKGALMALTRSLALELARDQIRVNCVAPSYVQTPMFEAAKGQMGQAQIDRLVEAHPLGVGRPLDVAHAIVYLLADTGAWVTGSTLVVDGGFTAR